MKNFAENVIDADASIKLKSSLAFFISKNHGSSGFLDRRKRKKVEAREREQLSRESLHPRILDSGVHAVAGARSNALHDTDSVA